MTGPETDLRGSSPSESDAGVVAGVVGVVGAAAAPVVVAAAAAGGEGDAAEAASVPAARWGTRCSAPIPYPTLLLQQTDPSFPPLQNSA